jgi:hypothetical protein
MADDRAIAHVSNFTTQALLILVRCLKNQGALGARQYEDALRDTLEAKDAPRARLDYTLLAHLLRALEKQQPGKPPRFDPVH